MNATYTLPKKVSEENYGFLRDTYCKTLNHEGFEALMFYVNHGHKPMNAYMRGTFDSERENYDEMAQLSDDLERIIWENPVDIVIPTLYRGTNQEHIRSWSVGDTVTFDSFMSTTTCPAIAVDFMKKKTPALFVIRNNSSHYGFVSMNDEQEVLLPPNEEFRVAEITDNSVVNLKTGSGITYRTVKNITVVILERI